MEIGPELDENGQHVYRPIRKRFVVWSLARMVAVSRLPQSAALIPVVGYAILFSDAFKSLLDKLWISGGVSLFSVEARLLCLWWGAVVMAAGWVIYHWCCPKEVQRNATYVDFALEQRQSVSALRLVEAREAAQGILKQFHPGDTSTMLFGLWSPNEIYLASSKFSGSLSQITSAPETYREMMGDDRDKLFALQYFVKNHSKPTQCFLTCSLLFGGAFIFLAPAVHSAMLVMSFTFKRLFV